ncbi:MAG: hypothetical protein A2506_09930 [Elusimicrobia bacterium RIFOXYD12_FULL_66_9]|nr:MAG: hypothetical protein A2506_09930 [Elusimicrobia bacterium RIFOXYD12_FULL_66_9]
MKITLAAIALLFAVTSNAASWDRLEGSHSGIKQQVAVAVQDARQWEALWSRHDSKTPAPQVDFSKESVVVVFLGERQSAGAKVEVVVQKDLLDASRLNVFYKEVVSRKSFSAQVVCQPFAIVKVPRAATIGVEKNSMVSIPENGQAPRDSFDGRKVRALLQGFAAPSFDGR